MMMLTAIGKNDRVCCDEIQSNAAHGQTGEHKSAVRVILQSFHRTVSRFRRHRPINSSVLIPNDLQLVFNDGQKFGPREYRISDHCIISKQGTQRHVDYSYRPYQGSSPLTKYNDFGSGFS